MAVNTRLVVEYDGTDYNGFQIQPNGTTIQGCLEEAISQLTKTRIRVIGAGRTDAGVHAWGQVVNFHSETTVPVDRMARALNSLLPPNIRVISAQTVPPQFHARFCAVSKTYVYQVCQGPYLSVFLRNYAWWIPEQLDWTAMRQAAERLIGRQDFTSFAASGGSARTSVRCLSRCDVDRTENQEGWLFRFTFTGDGFLYNMVRNLVGTLVDVGKRRLQPADMTTILAAKDRSQAGITAPAKGLFLVKVSYGPSWAEGSESPGFDDLDDKHS